MILEILLFSFGVCLLLYIRSKEMIIPSRNRLSLFFTRFTATKDRPRSFQYTVLILVSAFTLILIGCIVLLSL
jgi:hypothetical protein